MNKYLFRAKRKDNDEWIEGGYCYCGNESYIVAATRYIPDTREWDEADYYENNPVYKPTFIKVYSETVGQYTGLTDKNDTKIFEGDIVEGADFTIEDGGYGLISFEDGAFEVNGNNIIGTFHENYWGKEFEVIGNIHDNPELY